MLTHASAVEIVLSGLASGIFLLLMVGWLAAWRDLRNIDRASREGVMTLMYPRGSLRAAQQARRRQAYNLALALVFLFLTVYALTVAPPPPGTFWGPEQFTLAKGVLFIGMAIVGMKGISERHARDEILDAITEDEEDRRRAIAYAADVDHEHRD